jgi:tetratricopeptide (TPR) repeat protein
MRSALLLCVSAAIAAGPRAAAAARPHVDPEAIGEARRGRAHLRASGPAIAHYLEARRCEREEDWRGAVAALQLAVTYDAASPELRASLAEALALTGRLDVAEEEARRAVELGRGGPVAVEAHLLLAQLASARRRPEQAILELRQAVQLELARAGTNEGPRAVPAPEPWRALASAYLELGDEVAALRTLEDLAARVPGESRGFRDAGRWLVDRREAGRAERYLRRAVELDPGDAESWRLLARVHEALGRSPELRDDLLAIVRCKGEDQAPDALLGLGRTALGADDLEGARGWFARYLRVAPLRADAAVQVAYQWLEVGRFTDALQIAREAASEIGPDPRLRLAEGLALRGLRRFAEAARALAEVGPGVGGSYLSARAALADVLSRAGRHREAERVVAEGLRGHPGDLRLVTVRAAVLERAGRAREAAAALGRAAAERDGAGEASEAVELYAALGELLCREGRAPDAVIALRRAALTYPRAPALLHALALAHSAAGEPDAAAAQLSSILALDPDHAGALSALARALAERGSRLEEAERLARRGAALRPRSPEALAALGRVLSRRGDHGAAVAALEEAERIAGDDARILDLLGDAYRAAARPADAAAAWRRALASLGDESPAVALRLRAAFERKLREAAAVAR